MDSFDKIITSASENPALSILVFNSEGELEWVSNGFKKMRECSPVKGDRPESSTVFSLYDSEEIKDSITACIKERHPVNFICEIRTGNGKSKWIKAFVSPGLNCADHPGKFMAIEVDVTAFRIKEERIEKQFKKMKEIARNLEKANQLLEEQKEKINLQKRTIEDEQQRSEKLLLNILPFEVAKQLKTKGRAGTRHYKMVSVVFADFKGFSKISKTLEPKDLVNILDGYFARYDEIIEKHYLEKIKTIGDAYMFAGGLPLSNKSNPFDAVLASLEIQHYMNTLNDARVLQNLPVWELRIGIHTGPVVAGVVGKKRLAYDIWGDTVNIASRMEQGGHVGMVNISGVTYDYIREFFECDHRGKIDTKNTGKTDMYFVNRIRPKYSKDNLGMEPNDLMINLINKL
ncbi:MAG: hypothetical protein JXA61_04595 [Bacteroidales bacterium]|nr:hypothetical protein [Bacteroidales bacterium]